MNVRDHGYGDSPEPIAPPKVVEKVPEPCPNCQGTTLFLIKIKIKAPSQLKGKEVTGMYVGCAACQYASPMMSTAS